jgi:hypothetical protein
MPKAMTKDKWESLKKALLHVPIKNRNLVWKEAVDMIDHVLSSQNNIAPEVDAEFGRFAVSCELCHQPIGLDEDYVRKAITSSVVHYDCHMKSPTDRV